MKSTKATPDLFAAAVVPLAFGHLDELQKVVARSGDIFKEASVPPSTQQWSLALAELLRAYFCLASVKVCAHLNDGELGNLYGARMLEFLRAYPDPKLSLVRNVFADSSLLDDAIKCYMHDEPNREDKLALEDSRRILHLQENDAFPFFIAKFHIRVTRILGIAKPDVRWTAAWAANIAAVGSAWRTIIARIEPVFAEE